MSGHLVLSGLGVAETADVVSVSPETVMRDWKFAKGWLMRERSRAETRSTRQSDASVDALTLIVSPCRVIAAI
jgi:hypothetical protein